MQPRLDIKILPLKPQVLFNLVHHQLFNRTPRPVLRLPDDLPFSFGHFQRCADLVGVEVVNLVLGFAFLLIHAGQRRVAAVLVEVQALWPGLSSRSMRRPCQRKRLCSVWPLISDCFPTRRPRLSY
ncbi:hypothetical protein ALP06_200341 [Pseudomonas coronafaciens pv. atropurpurea]|nr:hypothetical protein ALP06_200341 [Pseudomonas coronafaciens pv. atropurpurea]